MSTARPLPLSLQADLAHSIRAQMERILAHDLFVRSPRLSQLLRFAVEMSLEGNAHCLKEYTIAVDVFKRPETFDCRLDSIVRVEAARLRKKLDLFYRTDGTEDRIVLKLPPSGYEPVMAFREDPSALQPGIPVIGVLDGHRYASQSFSTLGLESGGVHVVRVSRDSLERFHGRYDLVVVLIGESERPSDYDWVTETVAPRASALLFVSDTEGEAQVCALAKTLQAIASIARKPIHSCLATSKLKRQPVPIDSVA